MEFECDNAAFAEQGPMSLSAEVGRILRQAARFAEMGITGDTIRDINGNRVGTWEVTE
jgi:hypothetical protein